MPNKGDLRVWHVPQVPMKAFIVPVTTLEQAALVIDVLSQYDLFQFHENVKGDYANANGLEIYDEDPDLLGGMGWCTWYSADSMYDFDEWREQQQDKTSEAAGNIS